MNEKWLNLLSLLIMSMIVSSCASHNPYTLDQIDLANYLRVEIEDYPYPKAFPAGYFDTVLKPGIALGEVHIIVQGYSKVLHCDAYREVYYYFSAYDQDALRIEMLYDESGRYEELREEDENSKTISTSDCSPGPLLEEYFIQ
jgi:hypothetical protein